MKFNISLSKKFSCLLSLFVLITVGVLYLLVKSYDEPIKFGLQESKGNKYQRPVEKLFFNLAQHRVQAHRFILNGKDKSGLAQLQEAVDQSFSEIKKVNDEIGEDLQFTAAGLAGRKREHIQLATIQQEWKDLVGKLGSLNPSESNDLHAHLISDVRTIITHLGDTSNLILDPDLDSYYLMDITLLALPQIQDRIQNVAVEFETILRNKTVTAEDRVKASVFVAMMKESDLGRVTADFQTVLNEDPNFYGRSPSLETKLSPVHQKFVSAYEDLIKVVESVAQGNAIDASAFDQTSDKALAASFEYWNAAANEMDQFLEIRVNIYQNMKVKALIWSVLGMLVALSVAWLFLKYLIRDLRLIMGTLNHSSESVSSASNESASLAVQLSEASVQQAAGLQQTMASAEEISAMVRQNAESAHKTKDAVELNQRLTEEGSNSVLEMLSAIREIKEANAEILNQMEVSTKEFTEIVKIISEIGEKTKVINDIVFQTKLLSFNASVEAARAGEAGKGFAVVAEEVGNLASMSGRSSKEISEIVESSIKKVQDIVNNTKNRVDKLVELGKEKIEQGEQTVEKCNLTFNKITENAKMVTDMIGEIALATKEQSQGVEEINKAIIQIDQVTQKNSSVAGQSSHQSEKLNQEATTLAQTIIRLNSFVVGAPLKEEGSQAIQVPVKVKKEINNKVVSFKEKKFLKASAEVEKKKQLSIEAQPSFSRAVGLESEVPSANHPSFSEE